MYIYPDLLALITTPFDAVEDAYKLKKIMKSRYEDLIMFYLSTIPNEWRQEISDVFFYDFGRNLTKDLQSFLSKDIYDLITVVMTPPAIYQCMMLNYYLKGPGTDKKLLVEILCTVTKPEIAEIAETYETLYECSLAEHLASESDDLQRLLTHVVKGAGHKDPLWDNDRAWEAVVLLVHEGPAMWGLEQGTFVKILENESFSMIRMMFLMYKNIGGRTFLQVIQDEIYGELKNALFAIVNCISNPTMWLAEKLHGVMRGTDPDENAMVRIIVGRAQRDLVAINRAYDVLYDKTLQRAIVDFSEWTDTCRWMGNATFRRFVSSFYKPRNATIRNIAKKILFFTVVIDDVF